MSTAKVLPLNPPDRCHPYTTLATHPLPSPVRKLENELRLGLFTSAGIGTLMTVFGRPDTVQLELALETLLARMSPTYETDSPGAILATGLRAAAVANGQLRLCAQARRPEPHRLAAASRETHKAIQAFTRCGPVATNALSLLYHLQLHLALPHPGRRGRRAGGGFVGQLRNAQEWGRDAMAAWRTWSDHRFGPIQCLEWDVSGRFCKTVGYSFNGEPYEIHYVRDRVWHQQREWDALTRGALRPAIQAYNAWMALQQRLDRCRRRGTPARVPPRTGH